MHIGLNIGHAHTKAIIIDDNGTEQQIVFPSQIAPVHNVAGALFAQPSVEVNGARYHVGEYATTGAYTAMDQTRLRDLVFIPALTLEAFRRLDINPTGMNVVTGLPASWTSDTGKGAQLAARLRDAYGFGNIKVIAEPLGVVYAMLLDAHGAIQPTTRLAGEAVGVIDIGGYTLDVCVLDDGLQPVHDSMRTWQLGMRTALTRIQAAISSVYERDLTLAQTDHAVRAGVLSIAGEWCELPSGTDVILHEHGTVIANALRETWGAAKQFGTILIGGGGACVPQIAAAIQTQYTHATTVDDPQMAVARGYARLSAALANG